MPFDRNRLAIEAVQNIISNFGWDCIKQEITEQDLILTIKKQAEPGSNQVEKLDS